MEETEVVEISLFPIPDSVFLPFQRVPLHIFEPRYRKMIRDSVDQKRRVGVAHTLGEVAPARLPKNASREEILNHNLGTYECHPIFSAGFAKILETLPDGRMVVEIEMDSRYEVIEEIQQIPYKIVRCTRYQDSKAHSRPDLADLARQKLDMLLMSLQGPGTESLHQHLQSQSWKAQANDEYSFAIFSIVSLEADWMQKILEMKSSSERIQFVLDLFGAKGGLTH